MKKKAKQAAIIGNIVLVLVCSLLYLSNVLQTLENLLFDRDLKWSMENAPHEDIVVIGIDETSLDAIGRWPWDRRIYIPFLETLNQPESRPKAIGFDVLFTSESDPEIDAMLAETLAKYDNIVFPSYGYMENQFTRTTLGRKNELLKVAKLEKPIEPFFEATQRAHINAKLDDDGIIRQTWLQLDTPEDGIIPSLAFKLATMYGADVEHYLDYISSEGIQSEITINYEASSNDFLTVPFVSVLSGQVPPENFKDRIVLIGFTAVGFENDNGATPIEREMKLVYAHANIINQLLQNQHITHTSEWTTVLVSMLLVALTIYLTWRLRTIASIALLFAAALIALFGQYYIFEYTNLYINVVDPLAVLFLTYLVNIAIKSFYETKSKNFITKQFGRYISPDLVKEIASSDRDIPLGGINKELSILFLDIRGFTALSEKMHPEEVVDFLNTMFDMITEKTLQNHGTIDKFIGDAAMILFNAPLDVPNHEYYAVKTAYDIQKGMEDVRKEIEEKHGVTVSVGVGINTGNVIVGNIGSYLRVDYTAIGDNVNTASRIESNTEANQILVSEIVYERTREYFEFNYVGERMFKNKSVPVKIYELAGVTKELEQVS